MFQHRILRKDKNLMDYEKFLSNASDNVQKRADNIQINLDSASISRKIKENEKKYNSFHAHCYTLNGM